MDAPQDDITILALIETEASREHGYRLLVSKYKERLYWHIFRIVNNHDDADDVLQSTFLKIVRSIHTFKNDAQLYTWLFKISTNASIDFLSKKSNQTHIKEKLSEQNDLNSTSAYLENIDISGLLLNAIAILPEKQKAVFSLRYYEEMPYHQMSTIMNTSEGALKASYHHAVKKIENFIKENI